MLRLVEINRDNFWQVVALETRKGQQGCEIYKPVIVAQAMVCPDYRPLGIYKEEQPVGRTIYYYENSTECHMHHMMIDRRHQGLGYGKQAAELLINRIKADKNCCKLVVGVHHDNAAGMALCQRFGFVESGKMNGREQLLELMW